MKNFADHSGDFLHLLPSSSGHRIKVDPQFVGMFEIFSPHRVRMQFEARQVREPHERRRITRHDLLRTISRREVQLRHFDPGRPIFGGALLVEVLARDAVGIAHEHVRAAAGATQRTCCHRDVIARKVELGVPRLREQELLRVRDNHFAPGNADNLGFAACGHLDDSNLQMIMESVLARHSSRKWI
jgi:hypothetical protein